MAAALDVLCSLPCSGRRIAVLGEIGELGDNAQELHALVGAYAAAKPLDMLCLIGDKDAASMREGAITMGMSTDSIETFASAEIGPLLRCWVKYFVLRIWHLRKLRAQPVWILCQADLALSSIMLGNPDYPTYQVFLSIGIAAVISLVLMPLFIRLMRREGVGQQIRADGPQGHLVKQGTPTMGGVVILLSMVLTCFIMARWTPDLILCVLATIATALLGLLDDIESVAHRRSLGLTPSQKMIGLILIAVIFCLAAVNVCGIAPVILFPGGFSVDLGFLSTTISHR